jgi:glycosyltransferase involved in cell wall biosynthesis
VRVAIVSNLHFPDDDVFAREQAAALVDLGHEVTVIAPRANQPVWPTPPGVRHRPISWVEAPDEVVELASGDRVEVLHVYQARGVRRLLSAHVPAVVEITSTSLRPAPARHAALAWTTWEVRGHPVGCANRALVGLLRPADFYAPNGYSEWAVDAYSRRSSRRAVNPRLSVYQGTLSPLRRLDVMLESFAHVVGELPESELLLIGPGAQDELRRCAGRLGISDRVSFETRSGPEALARSLAAAALTVSWVPPTRGYMHQPPLKILDGQAGGVPILATRTVVGEELLRQGGGRTAEAEPLAFSRVWSEMLRATLEGATFPLQNRDEFLRQRSWRRIMRQHWEDKYRSAAHRPRRRSW